MAEFCSSSLVMNGRMLCARACVCVCIVLSVKDWYVFTDGAKLVDTKIWTLISLMARPTKLGQIDFKMVTKYGTVDEIVG